MIDLCIDARMAEHSGIGTCIRQLVPLLNQPPFRTILLVRQTGAAWCREMEQILCAAPIYSIREQAALPISIPSSDLFWSPHYNIPLLPIRAKKRIATIHDACHLSLSHFLSWPQKLYAKWVMQRALHHSDAVITDSLFSQTELTRYLGYPKRPIQVIPVAVNRDRFQKVEDVQVLARVKKKYHLPDRFVLFVGNLKPHKNAAGLIRAFALLSIPDLALVLVGKNQDLKNLDAIDTTHALSLGEVPEEDLPALYSLAAVFVFPSYYEGFGLPPLEAMSCGCPTIVSQAASLPEICGPASLYVNPADPEEIAQAIAKVITQEQIRQTLIEQGLRRVSSFDWSTTGQRYREAFERVHHA